MCLLPSLRRMQACWVTASLTCSTWLTYLCCHEILSTALNLYLFNAGLLGDGFPYLLDLARRRVVQQGAAVVPAAATVYCMGLEVLTGEVAGFNLAAMNTYR